MTKRITAASNTAEQASTNGLPPEVVELLARTRQLLADGQPGPALDQLARAKVHSPWVANAQGVCQLRLGKPKVALDIFRGLVLAAGGILLRPDVPAVFKTNYAIALLKMENLSGGLGVLAELKDDEHATVGRLKAAIAEWKRELSLWQKLNWFLGGQPARSVELSFPPGDLE